MVEEDRPSSKVGAVRFEMQYWTAVDAKMDQMPMWVRRIYCFLGPWFLYVMGRGGQQGLAEMCFVFIIDPLRVGESLEKFGPNSQLDIVQRLCTMTIKSCCRVL